MGKAGGRMLMWGEHANSTQKSHTKCVWPKCTLVGNQASGWYRQTVQRTAPGPQRKRGAAPASATAVTIWERVWEEKGFFRCKGLGRFHLVYELSSNSALLFTNVFMCGIKTQLKQFFLTNMSKRRLLPTEKHQIW